MKQLKTLYAGTKVTVNLNNQGTVIGYDEELDMYEVRLMDGNRVVGDVIVPDSSISVNEDDAEYAI